MATGAGFWAPGIPRRRRKRRGDLWQQRRWGGIVGGIGVGFDDDDFLIGDDFFGGVKEGETVDVVEERGSVVFFLREEFKGFDLESEGKFLEHFREEGEE